MYFLIKDDRKANFNAWKYPIFFYFETFRGGGPPRWHRPWASRSFQKKLSLLTVHRECHQGCEAFSLRKFAQVAKEDVTLPVQEFTNF